LIPDRSTELKGYARQLLVGRFGKTGLSIMSITPRQQPSNGSGTTNSKRIVATYPYVDENGKLLYEVVRYDPKDFRQRRPDGIGGWSWKLDGMRRVPYRMPLLLARSDLPIIVVEGEKDVDALSALGLAATTNAGGAGNWHTLDRDTLERVFNGRLVFVLPDNDDAGRKHAQQVAANLESIATVVHIVELPNLPDKGDVSDWLTDEQNDLTALAHLLEAASKLPNRGDAWEGDPLAPLNPADAWPVLDPLALIGLPGDIVRLIEPHSESNPSALLVQSLVMFGNVISRTAHFTIEGTKHHANEFVVLVGPTSTGRKGTSFGRCKMMMAEAEQAWLNERNVSGLSSAEGCLWAVRDPIITREKVNQGKGQAPTYEEVESDPGVADKRLMISEPEFASVLKQAERTGNTLSPILRQFWDGNEVVRTLTKHSPAKVTGGHISMIGHITPDELRRYLPTTEVANGFGNRHLFVLTHKSKNLPRGSTIPQAELRRIQLAVRDARDFAVDLESVGMSADAWDLWDSIYPRLTADRPGLAGALLARGAPHVRRLALIYAAMDRSYQVEVTHLMAADAVWRYCEETVIHLFGNATGDPVADSIADMLKAAGNDGLTRTDISKYLGGNYRSDRIGQALGVLLRANLARAVNVPTDGRPAERWQWIRGKATTEKTN